MNIRTISSTDQGNTQTQPVTPKPGQENNSKGNDTKPQEKGKAGKEGEPGKQANPQNIASQISSLNDSISSFEKQLNDAPDEIAKAGIQAIIDQYKNKKSELEKNLSDLGKNPENNYEIKEENNQLKEKVAQQEKQMSEMQAQLENFSNLELLSKPQFWTEHLMTMRKNSKLENSFSGANYESTLKKSLGYSRLFRIKNIPKLQEKFKEYLETNGPKSRKNKPAKTTKLLKNHYLMTAKAYFEFMKAKGKPQENSAEYKEYDFFTKK
ncbi:MAG TPA: hypothetical protein PKD96_02735 [Candidatus Absconditabacterales bacterium]|nr:hypothetical protein [Candidatus Absconditabacterales bacterium]HMT27194.1 hypothetical protein [Candidatus Absconditabacterales bacterium]